MSNFSSLKNPQVKLQKRPCHRQLLAFLCQSRAHNEFSLDVLVLLSRFLVMFDLRRAGCSDNFSSLLITIFVYVVLAHISIHITLYFTTQTSLCNCLRFDFRVGETMPKVAVMQCRTDSLSQHSLTSFFPPHLTPHPPTFGRSYISPYLTQPSALRFSEVRGLINLKS